MNKAVLAVVFAEKKEEAAGILELASGKLFGAGTSTVENVRGVDKKLKLFEVPINPSSMRLQGEGMRKPAENPQMPDAPPGCVQTAGPEYTCVSFELIVDGEAAGKTVNALMGMLSSETKRQVLFAWGRMSFPGEVARMSTSYEMFDRSGKPIRGKIQMTIRVSGGTLQQQYWEKAFQKLAGN